MHGEFLLDTNTVIRLFARDQAVERHPENDLWIASRARQHDLALVCGDRHFAEVEDLRCEQW